MKPALVGNGKLPAALNAAEGKDHASAGLFERYMVR